MKRRKLTKKERSLLWYHADGKCQACGDDLDPDNWHADHIVPFLFTKRTNIHEMQALCPNCNLTKGVMMLRGHQLKMLDICKEILAGRDIKQIVCDITPGGGKSALAVILCHILIPQVFDKLCWVVPRKTLRQQGEETFAETYLRAPLVLGHNCLIRQSTNDINPSRGYHGHITTYQAIKEGSTNLLQDFDRHRYILFLDEPHHVAVDSVYEEKLLPLIHRAGLVVLASGTLERSDKKKIAFVPYLPNSLKNNEFIVDPTEDEENRVIKYSRQMALKERAVLPLEFVSSDSKAEWIDKDGTPQAIDSFHEEDADIRSALRTVLETSFATQLIDKTVEHWRGHKKHIFKSAKLLVVSPNIEVAKTYLDHLNSLGVNSAIVHSKQKEGQVTKTIERFKKGTIEALVTIAIAYEGLDVPNITHVACLTNYRSFSWLMQCFARAVRPIGKKERGFIFVPDDPDINKIIDILELEQLGIAIEPIEGPPSPLGPDGPFAQIVPQGSLLTQSRAISPNSDDNVPSDQYRKIEETMRNNGFMGLSITQFNKMAIEAGYAVLENRKKEPDLAAPLVTPSEQERNLLKSIDTYTKQVDLIRHNMDWGRTSKILYSIFRKKRQDMTMAELQKVWRYLQSNYPLTKEKPYEDPYIG